MKMNNFLETKNRKNKKIERQKQKIDIFIETKNYI